MEEAIREEVRNVFLYLTNGVVTVLTNPDRKPYVVTHISMMLPHIKKDEVQEVIDEIYDQWREREEENMSGVS